MYIGIDTSCYTTSVAVIDNNENVISNERILLNVKKGNRGLRQSEAVFQHVLNMPLLIDKIFGRIKKSEIRCISVSSKPRPVEKSYMPVFRCGESFAKTLSSIMCVPLKRFSHQEGHIFSALISSDSFDLLQKEFLVFHISGGTTEILKVMRLKEGLQINIIGGTLDISAGQFLDRIGVAIGLNFPCGSGIEKYALSSMQKISLPVCVKDTWTNFSGPETKALKLINDGINKEDLSMAVLRCIDTSILKSLLKAVSLTGITDILMVGGVCSNSIIKENLQKKLKDINIYFALPQYSCDNAAGIAALGKYF